MVPGRCVPEDVYGLKYWLSFLAWTDPDTKGTVRADGPEQA